MHVAFCQCYTAESRDTAGTRRLRRVAEQLAARGHDVTVFCARWWDEDREAIEVNRVRYRAVTDAPAPDSFALRLPGVLWSRRPRPDVVHVAGREPWTVLAARAVGTIARVPVVADWFGDEPGVHQPDGPAARTALRVPARVVVPSRFVRTEARERGATAAGTTVVPESINVNLVERIEPAGDADVVASAWLDESANIDAMLLALAELRDRDWRATVIGDGPSRERYAAQARELRIDDRVRFPGDLELSARIARFRRAHVFVQTARRCPFATELLWGLAAGCVGVVAYQSNSSAHELVEGRRRGFRTTDEEELASAIAEAGELPHLDVDHSFDEYDHDAVLEQYLSLYREVAGVDA